MSIVAALDKVLFFNASSKYSVLRMKTEDSSVPTEARSPYRYHDHLIRFTAVGIELPQTDTVKIEMDGEWKDGKYGLQLQVDHWQEIVPPTLEGVRNYLASGLLKGIGEKTADAIIEKFGINALEILEHQPDRLLEIRGITKERLAEIKDAYAETSRMRVLMTLLAPFKVTPTTAQKIYQHFGPACADIVRQSPFNLCQVPGFGFMDAGIRHLRKYAQENDIPIDGIVVTYNDAAYAKSCGRTGHHYKDGLAFKFEDDTYETVLRSIEWTPSRTGEIAPVAIFDTVEIDGCAVSRASLHNLSFIENLELAPGCRIKVSKRNQIIPHVEENLDRDCYARDKVVPARCPCCGQPTRIHTTRNTVNGVEKVTAALFCDNEHCETRKLRKFVHFASPKALNIMGLSESILEKFIGNGWLHSYMDIFALDKHRTEIVQMEGFGEKSWQNLWDAIQHSRITTFEQYLTAMDIPMVGSTASKAICQRFRGNLAEFETAVCQSFDFTQLPDFGETLHRNIHQWFRSEENWTIWTELRRLVCIKTYQPPAASTDMGNPFVGKTLVVTGKVEPYTRDGINAKIESLGAHAGSSVSSKTDYLICGENAGSKLAKAQELGIKILSPDEFFRMAGESA